MLGLPGAVGPFRISQAIASVSRAPAMDTDLDIGAPTIGVSDGQAMTRQLDATIPGLDAALAVFAAPPSPDGSTEAP